ncbi:hypothetical protein [Burkholderia vietnamiensis]|uniref:hypothetical protein n=1 Tax=Burkholderia vietnamiensis TaxID=60552 RepID=UPI0026570BE8|nr:hypothetical protein [Burkholderia vietnamiensis]MDN7820478.1 hypothetical protein [Burkholderia vietnamiensis]
MSDQERNLDDASLDMQDAFERSEFYFNGESPAERSHNWKVWVAAWKAARRPVRTFVKDIITGVAAQYRDQGMKKIASEILSLIDAEHAAPAPAPSPADERAAYGSTDFGYTFVGIDLEEGDKRLMALLVRALGTDHPAIEDMTALLFRARAASANETGVDERAAKKPDVMTKAVKQLADWLLTDPNEGNPLCFAGPPEPFVLGLSRVKMRSIAGDEWTLIAGLQEGWLNAEQRASNFWRIAKLERGEVAREEAVAQYKEIRARAASANETGAEGALGEALSRARSALYAIAKTYDDGELRVRALEAYEQAADVPTQATAQSAEPVAIVDETDSGLFVEILYGENGSPLKCGDKLYAAPQPAQADARVGLTMTREQHGVLTRLATVLETGHANNGIADDNAEIYAMAIRALLQGANHAE